MGRNYTSIGLFSGAGGLDLGFEKAGFDHIFSTDIDEVACNTLRANRPTWTINCADASQLSLQGAYADVVLAGFPCQGFSLGGHRKIEDERNQLYKSAIRIVSEIKPRVVVFENVFNLRTMTFDGEVSAAEEISLSLQDAGYENVFDMLRCSKYDVPQTRRRFIFVGFRDGLPSNFTLPMGSESETTCSSALYGSALRSLDDFQETKDPNHRVVWGFNSRSHHERKSGLAELSDRDIVPVRLSRTASDGNPIRTFDAPMPALDTGTIWGFAVGNVTAERFLPDRSSRPHVRNRASTAKLWRIEADLIRKMTTRELASLQTFPESWRFEGGTWGNCLRQIGNAVPVNFAWHIAMSVKNALQHLDDGINLVHHFGESSSKDQLPLL